MFCVLGPWSSFSQENVKLSFLLPDVIRAAAICWKSLSQKFVMRSPASIRKVLRAAARCRSRQSVSTNITKSWFDAASTWSKTRKTALMTSTKSNNESKFKTDTYLTQLVLDRFRRESPQASKDLGSAQQERNSSLMSEEAECHSLLSFPAFGLHDWRLLGRGWMLPLDRGPHHSRRHRWDLWICKCGLTTKSKFVGPTRCCQEDCHVIWQVSDWSETLVSFHVTLSFQCNVGMWYDSVSWNDTLHDSRKMGPELRRESFNFFQ